MDVGGGIFIGVGACNETEQNGGGVGWGGVGWGGGPGERGVSGLKMWAVTFSRRLPGALLQGGVASYTENHMRLSTGLASDFPRSFLPCSHRVPPGALGGQRPQAVPFAF